MKLIVDINEDIYIRLSDSDIELIMDDIDTISTAIRNGVKVKTWLNSFNTDSATDCFNAVQRLKAEDCDG
jgi:hypothetical protein